MKVAPKTNRPLSKNDFLGCFLKRRKLTTNIYNLDSHAQNKEREQTPCSGVRLNPSNYITFFIMLLRKIRERDREEDICNTNDE